MIHLCIPYRHMILSKIFPRREMLFFYVKSKSCRMNGFNKKCVLLTDQQTYRLTDRHTDRLTKRFKEEPQTLPLNSVNVANPVS